MTGMKPKDMIELEEMPLIEIYPPEEILPRDRLYHCLLQPGEEHDNPCKRAIDIIWSRKTYRLSEVV